MHQHTWAAVDGVAGIIHQTYGVSAGLPCADLIFILAFARVMGRIRSRVEALGYFAISDTEAAAAFFGIPESANVRLVVSTVVYVDDGLFPVCALLKSLSNVFPRMLHSRC